MCSEFTRGRRIINITRMARMINIMRMARMMNILRMARMVNTMRNEDGEEAKAALDLVTQVHSERMTTVGMGRVRVLVRNKT